LGYALWGVNGVREIAKASRGGLNRGLGGDYSGQGERIVRAYRPLGKKEGTFTFNEN